MLVMTDRIRKLHYIKERKGIRSCSSGLPARIKYTIGGGRSNKILPSLLTSRPKHPDKAAGAFCIHSLSSRAARHHLWIDHRQGFDTHNAPSRNNVVPSFFVACQRAVHVKAADYRANTRAFWSPFSNSSVPGLRLRDGVALAAGRI